MKKTIVIFGLGVLLVCSAPAKALAWGSATHAYIACHIGKWFGLKNSNEIYGAMAADIFNYDFTITDPVYYCVRTHTHGIPGEPEAFMKVWYLAGWGYKKSAAYGLISHNDVWAADSTAHWDGLTYGQGLGYVIQKARDLVIILDGYGVWASLTLDISIPEHFQICEDISHNVVEMAGDILLKRYDPLIGSKVTAAAILRTPKFQDLLVQAINCADPEYVRYWENDFRNMMIMYGFGLMQSEQQAIDAFAEQLAQMSAAYLAQYGLSAPYDQVYNLSVFGIQQALDLIEDDYMDEINATIWKIRWQMFLHGVIY